MLHLAVIIDEFVAPILIALLTWDITTARRLGQKLALGLLEASLIPSFVVPWLLGFIHSRVTANAMLMLYLGSKSLVYITLPVLLTGHIIKARHLVHKLALGLLLVTLLMPMLLLPFTLQAHSEL